MADENRFSFDGEWLAFTSGQTVMQAAAAVGHYIPHLCFDPDFPPHGSCKLCSIKANGRYTSACFEPVVPGMVVESETDELRALRRRIVQMLFAEGNHCCPFCEKSGNCQLQAVAYYLGMMNTHYPHLYPRRQLDASHPQAVIDHDRCILCELCVRASREIDHKSLFSVAGRGGAAHLVVNSESACLGDTHFAASDRAAAICPVGAILPRRKAFLVPIGERRFDKESISEAGSLPGGCDER